MSKEEIVVGEQGKAEVGSLLLDDQNWRLGKKLRGETQEKLVAAYWSAFDVLPIAESLARNGYFVSEPLIVIKSEDKNNWVVIEGNRRASALLAITNSEIRDFVDN